MALKSASDAKAVRCVKITFSDGAKVVFAGYVGATAFPTGSAQQRVETPVQITAYGRTSAFSS